MKDTRPIGYWTGAGIAPDQPHEFQEIDDPGLAAFASGGFQGMGLGMNQQAVMTGNFIRRSRCGVPGCDRERHDPVHRVPGPA